MTYTEWRDELKDNLLCVSEAERRRVLDYYAEAYADRRDAGYTEREIIQDFGAPYDAAQRILQDNGAYRADYYDDPPRSYDRNEERRRENERRAQERERAREEEKRRREDERLRRDEERRRREDERRYREEERRRERENNNYDYYQNAQPSPPPAHENNSRSDYTWVFVILCIIFCVPLFGLIMGMVGITIGLCFAPFAVLISGIITVGTGIGTLFVSVIDGLFTIAIGLIIFGVGVALVSVFPRLVKLMWSVFRKVMGWIKSLFSGKEYRQ